MGVVPEPCLKSPGCAVRILRGCGFTFRGEFNRGFLVSARILSGVVSSTRVAGSSFMLRVKPKVKAVARCLTRTTERITTIRVSGALLPVLSSALGS